MTGSIHKKGKRYYIVFRIPDSDGKKKQKWISAGTSKREAEKKLIEVMGDIHNGTYKEVKKPPLLNSVNSGFILMLKQKLNHLH